MSAPQAVFVSTVTAVVVAIGLTVAGVTVLAGLGWALICAGVLVGPTAVGAGAVLLREGKP